MRAFLCAIVAIAGIAILFDYGLAQLDYSSADSRTGPSVRLDE
nr:hypothetical protein [Pararhizobium sp. IMCC3301]